MVFADVIVTSANQSHTFNALVDTGCATTLFPTETLETVGIVRDSTKIIDTLYGIGGTEDVMRKSVEQITLDGVIVQNFIVDLSDVDYGFGIEAIIGLDLLRVTHTTLDLDALTFAAK